MIGGVGYPYRVGAQDIPPGWFRAEKKLCSQACMHACMQSCGQFRTQKQLKRHAICSTGLYPSPQPHSHIQHPPASPRGSLQSRAQTAFFLLCWGRERKGLVDLHMWFCVTANAQNLGVILIYRVYTCTRTVPVQSSSPNIGRALKSDTFSPKLK